jgi:hypothetical protein
MPQAGGSASHAPWISPFTIHPTAGSVKAGRYDRQVTETTATLDQQLEEIRAQLAWVRDYL